MRILLILALLTIANGDAVFNLAGFKTFCHSLVHGQKGVTHHHVESVCNETCHFHKCPPCKVFSPLYEDGTCICPAETYVPCLLGDPSCIAFLDPAAIACLITNPLSLDAVIFIDTGPTEFFTPNFNITGVTFYELDILTRFFEPTCIDTLNAAALTSGVLDRFGDNAVSANADLTVTLNCTWDVVACKFIPVCSDGFTYDASLKQCVCDMKVDCVSKCKRDCGEPSSSDDCLLCDRMAVNPLNCSCVHSCATDNLQCQPGEHINVKTCKCVKNQCKNNVPCFGTEHFDSDLCACVPGSFCSEVKACGPFSLYDHNRCCCVEDPCTPQGLGFDLLTGNCFVVPCAGRCPSSAHFNANCSCVCNNPFLMFNAALRSCGCPNTCPSGSTANVNCTCICDNPLQSLVDGVCTCTNTINCTVVGTFPNPATCGCSCLPFQCPAPFISNGASCQCVCPFPVVNACRRVNGTLDANCRCTCPEPGNVFFGEIPSCQPCTQFEICDPGFFFDNITFCGCAPLPCTTTCDGDTCFTPANFTCSTPNAFILPFLCNCTNTTCPALNCSIGSTPDFETCHCVPNCTTVCTQPSEVLDLETCTCVPACSATVIDNCGGSCNVNYTDCTCTTIPGTSCANFDCGIFTPRCEDFLGIAFCTCV